MQPAAVSPHTLAPKTRNNAKHPSNDRHLFRCWRAISLVLGAGHLHRLPFSAHWSALCSYAMKTNEIRVHPFSYIIEHSVGQQNEIHLFMAGLKHKNTQRLPPPIGIVSIWSPSHTNQPKHTEPPTPLPTNWQTSLPLAADMFGQQSGAKTLALRWYYAFEWEFAMLMWLWQPEWVCWWWWRWMYNVREYARLCWSIIRTSLSSSLWLYGADAVRVFFVWSEYSRNITWVYLSGKNSSYNVIGVLSEYHLYFEIREITAALLELGDNDNLPSHMRYEIRTEPPHMHTAGSSLPSCDSSHYHSPWYGQFC